MDSMANSYEMGARRFPHQQKSTRIAGCGVGARGGDGKRGYPVVLPSDTARAKAETTATDSSNPTHLARNRRTSSLTDLARKRKEWRSVGVRLLSAPNDVRQCLRDSSGDGGGRGKGRDVHSRQPATSMAISQTTTSVAMGVVVRKRALVGGGFVERTSLVRVIWACRVLGTLATMLCR